jgi:hypothetical protein
MDFTNFADISEHKIFARYVIRVREVIHFLVPFQRLKEWGFYRSYLPVKCPVFLSLAFKCFYISEAIILEGIPDDFDVVV